MGKATSDVQKGRILGLREAGLTLKEIFQKTKVPVPTISRIIRQVAKRGNTERKHGSGRPRLLDKTNLNKISKIVKKNPRISSKGIVKSLNVKVSERTVKRELNNMSLFGRVAAKKPFLSNKNKVSRLKWANTYLKFSNEDWAKVIWSDESRFKIFGSDGRKYV